MASEINHYGKNQQLYIDQVDTQMLSLLRFSAYPFKNRGKNHLFDQPVLFSYFPCSLSFSFFFFFFATKTEHPIVFNAIVEILFHIWQIIKHVSVDTHTLLRPMKRSSLIWAMSRIGDKF